MHKGSQRSGILPAKRLNQKALKYIISKKGKKPADVVASEMKISRSWVYKIWQRHTKTGQVPQPRKMGRPTERLTAKMTRDVLAAYADSQAGVVRIHKQLVDNNSKISYHKIYQILKNEDLIVRSKAKSKRRKWVRYERRYSNAMWHTDWHAIKDPRLKNVNLIVYLDDASRCVTGFGMFSEATSENAVLVLRDSMRKFGTPGQILSDHGTQFTANRSGTQKRRKYTAYEQELADCKIAQVLARVKHPQTNGKIERFFRTLEEEVGRFDGIPEFMEYYNEQRLHFSLDIDNGETPRMAFRAKRATAAIRKKCPKWMEEDTNNGAT